MNGDQDPRRVFALFGGSGRSGTTLVRAIFDRHPELAVAMEANFLLRALRFRSRWEAESGFDASGFAEFVIAGPNFKKLVMEPESIREALSETPVGSVPEAVRAVFAAYARHHQKPLYGDKTPDYVKHFAKLAESFPEARFVHIIRDGRNTAVAYLDRGFGPESIGEVATYWKRNVEKGRAAGEVLGPERYAELRYEDLIEDPEPEVRRISTFLGLDYDAAMLEYWDTTDEVLAGQPRAHLHVSAARPPTKGLRDWRRDLTTEQIGVFQVVAGKTLERLGYEIDPEAVGMSTRVTATKQWLEWQKKAAAARWKGRKR